VDTVADIHPTKKKEVAARLANLALSETYGQQGYPWKSPSYASMAMEKDKIRISFKDIGSGLMVQGNSPTCFYIAGADGKFVPAMAKLEKNNTVLVWAKDIREPKHVRFAFTNTDQPNIFSKEGLPVNLFRTDQ
jgi:sialate O-acetylesterase